MTALKTISARIRGSKTELAELGEDTQELADGFSKYAKEIKALTGFDIVVEGTTDQFKDLYDIMEGISGVWDRLSDTQRARVAEILGGTRQFQVISSIIGNWKDSVGAYETAMESAGAATKANNTYMESAQAHINQFKVAFSDLAMQVVDSGLVADIADFGTGLLNILSIASKLIKVLSNIVKWLGGINGLLAVTATYFVTFKALSKSEAILVILIRVYEAIKKINISLLSTETILVGLEAILSSPTFIATAVAAYIALVIHEINKFADAQVEAANKSREASDKAKESLNESKEEFSRIKSDIESTNSELSTTTNRINELKSKGKLSFTEEEELGRLEKQRKELERIRDLLNSEELTKGKEIGDKFIKAFNAKMNEDVGSKAEWLGFAPGKNVDTAKYINQLLSMIEKTKIALKEGISTDFDDTMYSKDLLEDYAESIQKIAIELKILAKDVTYINKPLAELTTDEKAINAKLDYIEDLRDRAAIILDPEHGKIDAFNRLADNWRFDEAVQGFQDLGEQGRITKEALKSAYENNDIFKEFVSKLVELGVISGTTENDFKLLALAFNNLGKSADGASNNVKSFKDILTGIQKVTDGLEKLDKVYADVLDGGYFDLGNILGDSNDAKEFRAAFGALKSYEDFIKTIATNPQNIKACQAAFNKLTAEYLSNSDALKNVTDETRNMTVQMLKNAGVANAAQIVDRRLAINKTKLAASTGEAAIKSYEQAAASFRAAEAGSAEKQAYAELAIEKFNVNKTQINTSKDVEQLLHIAEAANADVESLKKLAKAKSLVAKAEEYEYIMKSATDSRAGSSAATQYRRYLEEAQKEIDGISIKYNPSVTTKYTGNKNTEKYNNKNETEKYVANVDKAYAAESRLALVKEEIAKLDHELNMTDDIGEQIRLKRQLLALYDEELNALKEVNAERDEIIAKNVETLRSAGFDVDYDPESDFLYIHNMEHLNELKGKNTTATNNLIKKYEKLINTTTKLNDENRESEEEWRNLEETIKSTSEEIREMAYDDDLKDMKFNIELHERNGASREQLVAEWTNAASRIESEIAYYRSKGYDETSDVIQDLMKDLWEAREKIRSWLYDDEIKDMKFNIELHERDGASKEQLISEWENVARRIEAEIAYYRAKGYDDTSDVIQELMNDLWDAKDQIKSLNEDIKNDAKDAVEKIVDLTKDLIRYETEQQIDAIEKQVDAYQKLIDKKKEALNIAKEEDEYEEEVAEKVKEIAKLQAKIDKLSLDDSRAAQIERQKLIEEMAEKQKDLSDYQRDYANEAAIDALDKEAERYSETRQKEIDALNDSISSEEKLYQAAIARINNSWSTLYQDLINYNTQAGNTINSEITENWNKAAQAVREYGSVVNALGISTNGASSTTSSSSSSSGGKRTIRLYREYANGRREYYDEVIDDSNIIGVRVFHGGGIAGSKSSIKDDEVLSVLQKGEVVLDDKKKRSLYKTIDFVQYLSEKLGTLIDENKLFDMSSVASRQDLFKVRPDASIREVSVTNDSSMVFSPSIEVNISGSGLDDDRSVRSIGERIANITLDKLQAAMEMKGVKSLRSPGLKA